MFRSYYIICFQLTNIQHLFDHEDNQISAQHLSTYMEEWDNVKRARRQAARLREKEAEQDAAFLQLWMLLANGMRKKLKLETILQGRHQTSVSTFIPTQGSKWLNDRRKKLMGYKPDGMKAYGKRSDFPGAINKLPITADEFVDMFGEHNDIFLSNYDYRRQLDL